jgi:intracellular sulfur oxidation DsrE/DsrF family protein
MLKPTVTRLRNRFLLLIFALCSMAAKAEPLPDVHPQVDVILSEAAAPDGVVFDIETLDANALNTLAPYVRKQIHLIRERFPDVDIAVVSHGAEEFALQKQAQSDNAALHDTFSQLTQSDGVSIHVCGAVGGLKGLSREDFPDFVSYSESGMAQLNDYKALGYQVVIIRQLSDSDRKALFDTPEKFIQP